MAIKSYGKPSSDNVRLTAWVPRELVERTRGAIGECPGKETAGASLSGLLVLALEEKLERLARKYHGGKPFPRIPAGSLKRGRKSLR